MVSELPPSEVAEQSQLHTVPKAELGEAMLGGGARCHQRGWAQAARREVSLVLLEARILLLPCLGLGAFCIKENGFLLRIRLLACCPSSDLRKSVFRSCTSFDMLL